MLKKIISLTLVVLSCLIVSCSQVKTRKVIVPEGEADWIYSAAEGCSDNEICASGEGDSFTSSDAHAKKALASIFEVQVKSEFQYSKESFSGDEKSRMQEFVEDEVNQQIDFILKGSYIKERFKKDGIMFSLAGLDKDKAANIILQELDTVDEELVQKFAQKNRIYIKKLTLLYNKRELLNEKLILIRGTGMARPVEISQINSLKFVQSDNNRVKLDMSSDTPRVLSKKIEEYFTSLGYKITKEANNHWLVSIEYKSKEEYLNVKGFKKFTFSLNIDAKNSGLKKVGSYIVTQVSSGRNEQDAFLKVRPDILKEIENNIDKLNLK